MYLCFIKTVGIFLHMLIHSVFFLVHRRSRMLEQFWTSCLEDSGQVVAVMGGAEGSVATW